MPELSADEISSCAAEWPTTGAMAVAAIDDAAAIALEMTPSS